MKYFNSGAVPPTQVHADFLGRCKRSCCWSPFGHIPNVTNCTCHDKARS